MVSLKKYSDEIIEFVREEFYKEKSKVEQANDWFNDFERIAFHVNRYFYKGRKRFSARDAEIIIVGFCAHKPQPTI